MNERRLILAIIEQAKRDYESPVPKYKGEVERFVHSAQFSQLCDLVDLELTTTREAIIGEQTTTAI